MTKFRIYDKSSGSTLAVLPLTIPIGSTIEGFEQAGISVGWEWVSNE